jgi:hypothetical protein
MNADYIVYTAIAGGYDDLKPVPRAWRDEADFVAFLDEPQTVPGWEIRPLCQEFGDPCRNAKVHKVLAHRDFPKAKYSLWIDGSILIKSELSLRQLFEKNLANQDLALFRHRYRNCLYAEAAACAELAKDSCEIISRQIARYQADGYPARNGLAECCVLWRRHTDRVRLFNEAWFDEIRLHSRRDQISFNYILSKHGLRYQELPGLISKNEHFAMTPHRRPRHYIYA